MQNVHFAWLARHPLRTAYDAWRAESAAFAFGEDMQPLVQQAVLGFNNLAPEVETLLLRWGYVLNVQAACHRLAPFELVWWHVVLSGTF